MLTEELAELIGKIMKNRHDHRTVEVRAATEGCPRIIETLSSFSNRNSGGVIVFGLDEEKGFEPVGVYDAQDLQKRTAGQCRQTEPETRAFFTVCEMDGKEFVSMEIPPADVSRRPVFYKGAGIRRGSYVRVGEADEHMSEYEIYAYEAYRKQTRDDLRPSEADESCLDGHALDNYVYEVRNNRPNASELDRDEFLRLSGLVRDGVPSLAAVMCFSKYPQAVYPQLCVTAVLVPGTAMGDESPDGRRFLANRRIDGTIPQMTEGAVNFVAMNMKTGVAIRDGKRTDIPEYPITAVREAVLNALIHRDYSRFTEGIPVRVEMYADRLEITSPGGLYGGADTDDLGRVRADTRNKTLISVLETTKVVENRYSGIPAIRRSLRDAGLPDPVFAERKGFFTVTFRNGTKNPDGRGGTAEDLVEFCRTPRTRAEVAGFLGKTQYYVIKNFVEPVIARGLLSYTLPDKPKSRDNRIVSVP